MTKPDSKEVSITDQGMPTYTLPNKIKHDTQNTNNENVSSGQQKPTYALPNKKKPGAQSTDIIIPTYALISGTDHHTGKALTHNIMYGNEGDGSIYYSQVPIENKGMENSNLAYSVVNLKKRNQATNVGGLNHADVDLPNAQRNVYNNESDDMTVAYSEVKN